MAKALRALIKFYQTGETKDREAYDIAWVAGQGVAGRHDQRLHRGLSRRARHQGRVGSARLLRQPAEDRRDPEARRQRAVVRGPDAVGSEVPQAGRPGHHRQRHRRRHRDRRLRSGDADRHQPAERSGGPRALRQQVGVALERQRSVRQVDAAGVPQRVRVDAGGSRARREVERARRRADDEHARSDRPRVGQGQRAARRATRRRR